MSIFEFDAAEEKLLRELATARYVSADYFVRHADLKLSPVAVSIAERDRDVAFRIIRKLNEAIVLI